MATKLDESKAQALERLLHEARAESKRLKLRLEAAEKILLSTRLIMGHELKKPATAISGYLDLALDDDSGANLRVLVRKARKECDALAELNEFFLELAKIGDPMEPRCGQRLRFRELVNELLRRMAPPLEATRRVQVEVGDGTDDFLVNADALKIIVGNLIENALLYSFDGTPVRVYARRDGNRRGLADRNILRITVADAGRGIPSEHLKRVFAPFVRLGTDETEGSGLGLTLAKTLAELYGGDVSIQSELDTGTTADVTMPELQWNSVGKGL